MNQHFDDIPPFDDASQEREWLAQESALRRERLNLDPAGDDERGRRYRQLARALHEPLPDGLPADFAMRVAVRAAAASSGRFEFVLMIVLVVALVIAAGVVIATYGGQWTSSFSAILAARNTQASVWLMALAGCLGASWLMERWQRHERR
jgi:hypothetical protein